MSSTRSGLATFSLVAIATILIVAVLRGAGEVFAPLACALFMVALVWPLQRCMQRILPRSIAFTLCFLSIAVVFVGFGWILAWAFSNVLRGFIADASHYQSAYESGRMWLAEHGVEVGLLGVENFNVGWALRTVQTVGLRLNSTATFWFIALLYVLLGLMEVEDFRRRILAMGGGAGAEVVQAAASTMEKLVRYMLIRTVMSIATGAFVWLFAIAVGLPLAAEWGVLAFALNYIPVIGPLVATCFPTLFAITHLATWEAVIGVFLVLNIIQFVIGSYIEPRVSGTALAMSPALVLFAVFFWGYLWGIFGAFIGVPIFIAALTFCARFPSSRWIAVLFGAAEPQAGEARGPTVREEALRGAG